MRKLIRKIVAVLTRYHQKHRISVLVGTLPGDMRPAVLHDLLEIIDLPDRVEKVRKTRAIFHSVKEQLEAPYREKLESFNQEYAVRCSIAASNVIVPDFPMPRLSINHVVLEEKAKMRLTLQSLEEEIMSIPNTRLSHACIAILGVLFSCFANYMTIKDKYGIDWLGGNEVITTFCNIFVSLVLCVFEALGPYCFLHFMPNRYTNGVSRILGMAGALVIVVSICVVILSRTEVGNSVITTTHDMGKVE